MTTVLLIRQKTRKKQGNGFVGARKERDSVLWSMRYLKSLNDKAPLINAFGCIVSTLKRIVAFWLYECSFSILNLICLVLFV